MPSDERENILIDEAQIISLETHSPYKLEFFIQITFKSNFLIKSECFSRLKS